MTSKDTRFERIIIMVLVAAAVTMSVHAEPQPRSNQARNAGRIVHGEFVRWGQGPWAVSIQRLAAVADSPSAERVHYCGGSLVSPVVDRERARIVGWRHGDTRARWVVTAAHCVVNDRKSLFLEPEDIYVLGGTLDRSSREGGEVQEVIDVIYHEDYNAYTLENDIALLRLASSDEDPDAILRTSIRLPTVSDTPWINEPYLAVWAQGWGNTETGSDSVRLKEVLLPLVDNEYCRDKFGIHGWRIGDGVLCAGFSSASFDACQGDSGGPLVYRAEGSYVTASRSQYPVLVGVVSWGIGCGSPDLFGVYTSVAYYRGWIEQQVVRYLELDE